jgi:hypothetical protein
VLRERGLNEEAERMRASEVIPMVVALRTDTDSDAAVTERLNSLFATEAERVANAAVLAELLLPTLSERLRPPTAPVLRSEPIITATPVMPAPKPAVRPASIADFIDDMIAQERPPNRPGQGAQRRAS